MDTALLVLGGRAPSPSWLSEFGSRGEVWAVDRGVEACRAAGIIPRRLVGDCDSASAESWRWAADNGVPVERYQSDKDLTDFQLALELFREKNKGRAKKIFLTGAWGGRFDHLWSLVLTFLNFSSPHVPFCIAGACLVGRPRECVLYICRKAEGRLAAVFFGGMRRRIHRRRPLAARRGRAQPRLPLRDKQPPWRRPRRARKLRKRPPRLLLAVG